MVVLPAIWIIWGGTACHLRLTPHGQRSSEGTQTQLSLRSLSLKVQNGEVIEVHFLQYPCYICKEYDIYIYIYSHIIFHFICVWHKSPIFQITWDFLKHVESVKNFRGKNPPIVEPMEAEKCLGPGFRECWESPFFFQGKNRGWKSKGSVSSNCRCAVPSLKLTVSHLN